MLKLVMLMAITSAQRGQSIHLLDTKHMDLHKIYTTFRFKTVLKGTRPGKGLRPMKFKAYAPDRRICPITKLFQYLKRTNILRTDSQLFISHRAPHKKVGRTSFTMNKIYDAHVRY